MPEQNWELLGSRVLVEHRILRFEADRYRVAPSGNEADFVRMVSDDWVNIVPLTAERHVVMVRQYRHGIRRVTLEIPGGMVDADESPAAAGLREMRQETGYAAEQATSLGEIWPNPAILSNVCHFFLAEGVQYSGEPTPDSYEHIEVVLVPLSDIPRLIREGEIRHALVIAAFAMMGVCATPHGRSG